MSTDQAPPVIPARDPDQGTLPQRVGPMEPEGFSASRPFDDIRGLTEAEFVAWLDARGIGPLQGIQKPHWWHKGGW